MESTDTQPKGGTATDAGRADGGSATTQAVDIDRGSTRWRARPAVGAAIRLATFLIPAIVSIACTRVYVSMVPQPDGLLPAIGYWAIALGVSVAAMVSTERLTRRLAPLPPPRRQRRRRRPYHRVRAPTVPPSAGSVVPRTSWPTTRRAPRRSIPTPCGS